MTDPDPTDPSLDWLESSLYVSEQPELTLAAASSACLELACDDAPPIVNQLLRRAVQRADPATADRKRGPGTLTTGHKPRLWHPDAYVTCNFTSDNTVNATYSPYGFAIDALNHRRSGLKQVQLEAVRFDSIRWQCRILWYRPPTVCVVCVCQGWGRL